MKYPVTAYTEKKNQPLNTLAKTQKHSCFSILIKSLINGFRIYVVPIFIYYYNEAILFIDVSKATLINCSKMLITIFVSEMMAV